ncbi:MAG: adenylate cyclase [Alphaproteobacteria bacterium]|jgi:adenylate cyclase|nr:adenylate cyclase [Alphaproteobacteria bacterium]MEA2989872.1 adenylate cyclase [Alphaproteobacteria bacterium]
MTRLRDLVRREPKPGIELPAALERLVSVGIVSSDPLVVRRQRCVNVAAFATAANTLSHLLILSFYDFRGLLVVNVYNVLMIAASLAIPRLHRLGENTGAVALILMILVGNMFVVCALGRASSLHIYFTLGGATLLLIGVHQWRIFLVLFALFVIALLVALNLVPVDGFVLPQDRDLRELLTSHAMINTIMINAAMLFYALTALHRAEVELQDQHERSEALIETMMPQTIAERLKSGREPRIADRIEMLSVMFADLVGFTEAAHELPPEQVVEFLDSLVRACDALCEQHGVEKIKTIGDSYMAAAGFDGKSAGGAAAVGRLALALLEGIARQPPLGGRKLKLRIGIHCGPATAGVIGDMRFSYDIWGDAVNTASRMESYGEPDRIHVSAAFCKLAGDAFVFEERGETEIKGIGIARTYFLLGLPLS